MNLPKQNKWDNQFGFTLIELLVVIAVIGLLASVMLVSMRNAQVKAREDQRKADLRVLSNALEMYFQDNGHYPSSSPSGFINFFGESQHGGSIQNYIPGLVPTYIASLPHDPMVNQPIGGCDAGWAGYWYASDYYGKDYQLKVYCGSEEGNVSSNDAFYNPGKPTSFVISTPGAINW